MHREVGSATQCLRRGVGYGVFSSGIGFRVSGLGKRVWGIGFRV